MNISDFTCRQKTQLGFDLMKQVPLMKEKQLLLLFLQLLLIKDSICFLFKETKCMF